MALIPLTYKLDWYDPSQPGGVMSTINNNANTATSSSTQYSMQDIIDTVPGGGLIPWPYQYVAGDFNFLLGENPGATGTNNTALGVEAGASITDGQNNVFIGAEAGKTHTGGFGENTGIGAYTLRDLTTGRDNTTVGYYAGLKILDAGYNTAIGAQCMFMNEVGDYNTGLGAQSMRMCIGEGNTGLGYYAMAENQSGNNNVAVGKYAAQRMNSGSPTYTVCVGAEAGDDWNLGASNTIIGGQAGAIASPQSLGAGTENVLLGFQAATDAGTDNNSIVIGANARGNGTNSITIGNTNNTTLILPGLQTTASDGDVLTYSTATGDIQLQAPGGGGATDLNGLSDCLIDGTSSYLVNVPAGLSGNPADNTVFGSSAGNALTTGDNNVIVGSDAAVSLTTGSNNIVIGTAMIANVDCIENVVIGNGAMDSATSDDRCVAIGTNALAGQNQLFQPKNTAVGYAADDGNTTGYWRTCIGADAGRAAATGNNVTNIGYSAGASSASASNEVTLGDSSVTALRCAVTTITAISDERDKTSIEDLPYGLDFVDSLKPRKFVWDHRAETKKDGEEFYSSRKGSKDIGFIAQELQEVDDEWTSLVYASNPDKLEASYGRLIPVLVKAIQELKAEVEALKAS